MSEAIEDEVIETITDGELLTLNQLVKILGGHPNTIKKLLEGYESTGTVKTGVVKRKNRDFKAYYTTNKLLAELQYLLKEVRKSSSPVKLSESLNVKLFETSTNKGDKAQSVATTTQLNTDDVQLLDNVKFYEVVKQNNDLENQVKQLQAERKDFEVAKAKEISMLKEERMKFETELYKAQSDIKLIEDKSKTMESAYAEQKLEVDRLNKVVHNRNVALIILGAILLIVFTVVGTLALLR